MSGATLSIVIPARDERESLPVLVEEIAEVRARLPELVEVIVVDDGSTDGSLEVIEELGRRFAWIRAIRFDDNRGQTAALAAGIEASCGELVATLDADLQYDPSEIPLLISTMDRLGADMVAGVRVRRMDSLWKRVQSRIGNGVRNLITGDRVRDTGCTLRVARRSVLVGIFGFDGAHRFVPTLVRIRGGLVAEEPVRHRPRRFGRSKYGAWNRALDGLALCFRVRRLRKHALR